MWCFVTLSNFQHISPKNANLFEGILCPLISILSLSLSLCVCVVETLESLAFLWQTLFQIFVAGVRSAFG